MFHQLDSNNDPLMNLKILFFRDNNSQPDVICHFWKLNTWFLGNSCLLDRYELHTFISHFSPQIKRDRMHNITDILIAQSW